MLCFTTPTPDDIAELCAHMRVQDVAEVRASGRNDLRAVVDEGVRRSVMCYAVRVDGRLAAIFGLAPYGGLLSNIGVPWMLGTPEVPRHRRILARYSKPYIASMLAAYPHLINAVHARNTVAVRWLRHAGFTLHAAQPYGPHGEPFHVFEMTRNV